MYDKQRELVLFEAVVTASNESSTVEETLQSAIDAICHHTGWPVGHVYLHDPASGLVPTSIWHVEPADAFPEFRRMTEATVFSEGVGLPGRVLATRAPAWITDVTHDSNFPRKNLGVRGAFAFPIIVGGEVTAVLEHFSAAAVTPDDALLQLMSKIGRQIGWVLERIRSHEQTAHQAVHDALTGLPNRSLFHDRLEQALRDTGRGGAPLSVLMIDLDRFKEVNDTLGHANGDLLLVQVGPRLRAALRERDTIARMGGDEFAVLLPDTDAAGACLVAANLHRALEEPFALPGLNINVQASVGISCSPEHGSTVEILLQRADVAMYLAKQARTGHALYASDQDHHDPDRLALAGELRRAISDDEFVLHYQPKLDLTTGEINGVEALVRWQHPVRGLLPPDQFVPLAEHTGVIGPLTLWVLDRALSQCSAWLQDGRELSMAVNLSVQSLLDPGFAGDVGGLLERHEVPPRLLELEITESSVMSDPARSIILLGALRDMGIRLSIDDFGTGYSSLAYLKRLPVQEIKIDKGFVIGMDGNADDAVIVRSTIDLGHNLGLAVAAEGVETERSLSGLRALGCDSAQGYLISRAVPVDELDDWLRARIGRSGVPGAGPADRPAARTPPEDVGEPSLRASRLR